MCGAKTVTMWIPLENHQEVYALVMPRSHDFVDALRQRNEDVALACAPHCGVGGAEVMEGKV